MIQDSYHIPVLFTEVLDGLALKPDGTYLDCTLGGGGHFRGIAKNLGKEGCIIGVDRDDEAIEWVKKDLKKRDFTSKVIVAKSRFADFDDVLKENNINGVDGILADLGVSSHQIDAAERGFTYKEDSFLDMRMDRKESLTAQSFLETCSIEVLSEVLREYGEVKNAHRMAVAIKRSVDSVGITTSEDLKACLSSEYGHEMSYKVLSKIFQALRIAVNGELEQLKVFLNKSVDALNKGGRLVIISYHSLEDRMVKEFIREKELSCICPPDVPFCICDKKQELKRVSRKAIKASEKELEMNSRSRSARMRIAEKM